MCCVVQEWKKKELGPMVKDSRSTKRKARRATRTMLFQTRAVYAVLFFCLTFTLLVLTKPALLFDKDGNVKHFGVKSDDGNGVGTGSGNDVTLFPMGVAVVLLAVGSMYVFAWIDMVSSSASS